MESEKVVTKLLQEREILRSSTLNFLPESEYNLGKFLNEIKSQPNPYDSRFVFIK